MNASNNDSAQNLLDSTTQETFLSPASGKPLESLRSPPLDEQWMDTMMQNMKRMATDEAYRLEIAQRLS